LKPPLRDSQQIRSEIQTLNSCLDAVGDRLESLTEHYNSQVEEASAFIESIHEAQEAYSDSRSEGWADSDQGDTYRDWAESWEVDLEPFDVELSEPMDEPEFTALDTLRDIPVQP